MANIINRGRQWELTAEQVFDFSDLAASPSGVTVKLPVNAIYTGGVMFVETAFNGTTPTVSLGTSGGSATAYLAATSVSSVGATALSLNTGIKASGDTITITPNAGAIASTAGKGRLLIKYIIADRSNEVQP